MLRILLASLLLLVGMLLVYRIASTNKNKFKKQLAQSNMQTALLEIDRLLGDSLTAALIPAVRQMADILASRLDASLVVVGLQRAAEDSIVDILALAGPRQEVAVGAYLLIDHEAADGSLAQALKSGMIQYRKLRGDSSYLQWQIPHASPFQWSLTIPYRSLDGSKGVMVLFVPKAVTILSPSHTLWTRLADDYAVFLERRKNTVDVRRVSEYQSAIADLLKDTLEVTSFHNAYELVLTLLITRFDAHSAWFVEYAMDDVAFPNGQVAAVRGRLPEPAVKRWCTEDATGQQWLSDVFQRVKRQERGFVEETRSDSRLEHWQKAEPSLAQTAVFGAWPLLNKAGLKAILFVTGADANFFGNSLQVFLRQVIEVLHIADRQIRNMAEIQRRTLLYQALLDEADAVLKTQAEQPLVEEVCRRLVERALFEAAFLVRPEKDGTLNFLASANSVVGSSFSPDREAVTKLECRWILHAFQAGKVIFPRPESQNGDPENIELPMALLPVLRNGRLWGILVVRSSTLVRLSTDEIGLLQRVASLLGRGLDELDLKQQLAAEQHRQTWLATHDALTGLNNRRGLEGYFTHALLRAQRNKTLLAVVIVDLDDFKPVNDTYGHEAGDRLLIQVARVLQGTIRSTDFLVRLGGDEFVLLLEGLHGDEDLEPVMSSIHNAVETPISLGENIQVSVGCSAGLTLFPKDASAPDSLLRHADEALYVAKRTKQTRARYWVSYLDILAAETDA